MKRYSFVLALLLAAALLSCNAKPAGTVTQERETPSPSVLTAEALAGTWQGTATYTNTLLLLRADGTGALIAHAPADGGAFREPFLLGTDIVWQLSGNTLTFTPLPSVLPDGSVYQPKGTAFSKTVALQETVLTLTDEDGTELYIASTEPAWYTVAAYATAKADWLIGKDAENAEELYAAFYADFAAGRQ